MECSPLPLACLTFDLHASDRPDDIARAVAWLEERAYPATFFVPAAMFDEPALCRALQRAACSPLVEMASHSYEHSLGEIEALLAGTGLGFLDRAYDRHCDAVGTAPLSFRAPCWVPMADAAIDRLATLGYRVDSSATPGRPPLLSSFVGRASWRDALRTPHWLRPSLLEVPQSTRWVPFAVPTFMTLRTSGSRFLARHLGDEVRRTPGQVLVLMLHVGDLNAAAPDYWRPAMSWNSFVPRRGTGFALKYAFRETRRPEVAAIVASVLEEIDGKYAYESMGALFERHHAVTTRSPFAIPSHTSASLVYA